VHGAFGGGVVDRCSACYASSIAAGCRADEHDESAAAIGEPLHQCLAQHERGADVDAHQEIEAAGGREIAPPRVAAEHGGAICQGEQIFLARQIVQESFVGEVAGLQDRVRSRSPHDVRDVIERRDVCQHERRSEAGQQLCGCAADAARGSCNEDFSSGQSKAACHGAAIVHGISSDLCWPQDRALSRYLSIANDI
jgi:hypothetical protein